VNKKLERIWKEAVVACALLSRHLSGVAEGNRGGGGNSLVAGPGVVCTEHLSNTIHKP
jgi:hypothetical protein